MQKILRIVLSLLPLALILVYADNSRADWSTNPAINSAVCTLTGDQNMAQICSDGTGGVIVAWQDFRNGNVDIYAQRFNASGIALWTSNGIATCTATNDQTLPHVVSDLNGGAIVVWQDERASSTSIFAQHLDDTGSPQWTPDGIPLSSMTNAQTDPQVASDGLGGAIVAWTSANGPGDDDIYAQRIISTGTLAWAPSGERVCGALMRQQRQQIISDGQNGAFVIWDDARVTPGVYDIYGQRLHQNGTPLWTSNGVVVSSASASQYSPQLTADDAGGFIAVWEDSRSGANIDLYAQRVSSSGTVHWSANGVPVCTETRDQINAQLVSDSKGGAVVVWQDTRDSNTDIYAQHIYTNGTLHWTNIGQVVCNAQWTQANPQLVSDGRGGAIIAWEDIRSNEYDIYAQYMDGLGHPQWDHNGQQVCRAANHQQSVQIAEVYRDGAVLVWTDQRNGADDDVYIQRLDTRRQGLWVEAEELGGDWLWSSWFGFFAETGNDWIYHNEHGWMYTAGITTANLWLWTTDMGWLWTSDTLYPYIYRHDDSAWLWYELGSASPRWFYNFTSGQWESH